MKIAMRLILAGMFITTMAVAFTGCKDEEKTDCEKVCDKLNSCCDDWDGDSMSECKDTCKAQKDATDSETFDAMVDAINEASCDELQFYCGGYDYY